MRFLPPLFVLLLVAACGKPPPTTVVHEFYNAGLDRYFRTANADEAAALRGNPASGEVATGNTFLAYPRTGHPESARPVCRFYGSVSPGPNSHFYTADAGECDALKKLAQTTPATEKRWNFEEIAFAINVPAGGSCTADSVPVYRTYNDGFARGRDSNHRFTTDPAIYKDMLAKGWRGENVVMCAPRTAG
jgi:hypothetical protein